MSLCSCVFLNPGCLPTSSSSLKAAAKECSWCLWAVPKGPFSFALVWGLTTRSIYTSPNMSAIHVNLLNKVQLDFQKTWSLPHVFIVLLYFAVLCCSLGSPLAMVTDQGSVHLSDPPGFLLSAMCLSAADTSVFLLCRTISSPHPLRRLVDTKSFPLKCCSRTGSFLF